MTRSRTRAERLAKEALRTTGQTVPVDIMRVAECYGLLIRGQELEDDVSGMLLVKDKRAIIGINRNHHPNRQRFTIAHEIGHYLMHTTESQVFIENLRLNRDELSKNGNDVREIEANAFAAELLMPTEVLRQRVGTQMIDAFFDDLIIRNLASEFKVSAQAMAVKLSRVNLLS